MSASAPRRRPAVVQPTHAGQADQAQQREGHNENEKRNHATHLSDVRTRDTAAAPTTMATSAGALIGAALQVIATDGLGALSLR